LIDQSLADRLAAIVGARRVLYRPSELLTYTADALPSYFKQPALAVFPGTRDETVAVVRELAARGVPFVPRGAGTGLSGGALADGIVLLGLNRLTRVISVDHREGSGPAAYEVESEPDVDVRRELARAVVTRGWGLLELRPVRMSLEDVFLQVTTEETGEEAARA